MLWVEKYRPKTFEDVIGNNKQKKEIQEWVDSWKKGNPQPALLLVGPAGTGKTTMAHIIANEFSEFIELNASDKRSKDVIMSTVGESSSTMSLFGQNKKLIIMDEVDGLQGNQDRGGASALNKIIKDSKQPIVMMANDFYSKQIATIKNNSKVVKMTKIRTPSITALLRKILREEGVDVNQELLKKLSKRSNGDLRSALNTLQVIVEKGGELDEDSLEITGQKDNTATIFDGVTRVLKSKDVSKVKKSLFEMNEDPSLVMEYIAENIPREYENKEEIKKAYDMISKADLFFGRTNQTREYAYWRYASDFMGPGVALSKKQTYKKFSKIQSPMAFSLMARSRGKRALRDRIAEKIELKMHVSLQVAYTMFSYFEIIFQNDELAWEIADFLELEDDEIKRFRKKKIPKKVITKMEKKKQVMREEEKEIWREEIKQGIFSEFNEISNLNNENINTIKENRNEKEIVNISDNTENLSSLNENINNLDDNKYKNKINDLLEEITEELDINSNNIEKRIDNKNNDNKKLNIKKNKDEKSKKVQKEKPKELRDEGQTSLFNF